MKSRTTTIRPIRKMAPIVPPMNFSMSVSCLVQMRTGQGKPIGADLVPQTFSGRSQKLA